MSFFIYLYNIATLLGYVVVTLLTLAGHLEFSY